MEMGYTFGAGFRWGIVVDYGLYKGSISGIPVNYGFSYSLNWVYVKNIRDAGHHRLSSLSLMAESENFDVKIGYGLAVNPWGYSNTNACLVRGLSYDVSFTNPTQFMPWIGYKSLVYRKMSWVWFDHYYNTLYTKYKYDFNESGLKQRSKLL